MICCWRAISTKAGIGTVRRLAFVLGGAKLAELRATPLDPPRPALDLLEDLFAGIRGCRLLYEQAEDDDRDERGPADADADPEDRDNETDAVFPDLVCAEAARAYDRLVGAAPTADTDRIAKLTSDSALEGCRRRWAASTLS